MIYDGIRVGYCQTTQEAKDNITKIFEREYIIILGELKIFTKIGNKLYLVVQLTEVV